MTIRNELESDHRAVEELTREAFWNRYVPGCDEHYLVHKLRGHPDFVPELDFVLLNKGMIVAHVMYSRSSLVSATGERVSTLTFGPVSVLPSFQRQGLGSLLLEFSLARAKEGGGRLVVIEGVPGNYVKFGFRSCQSFNVTNRAGAFPTALLVKELEVGALVGGPWTFRESEAFQIDDNEAQEFDKTFRPLKKEVRPSQEEFKILSRSVIV